MSDSKEKKRADVEEEQGDEEEGFEEIGDRSTLENANLASVDSKTVNYEIMNPDFYKEPKTRAAITGPCGAHEFVTRKPKR